MKDNKFKSKHKDIELLLNTIMQQSTEIRLKYEESLNVQNIPDELLVLIKNYCENAKSILDYSVQKICKSNFPIRLTEKDFINITQKYPSKIKTILKKWQPFNSNEWIGYFNILNNKNKHIGLVPQKRTENVRTIVESNQGNSSVSWGSGVTFGGVVSVMGVPINPATQLPIHNQGITVQREIWVNFLFSNEQIPALPDNINVLWLVNLIQNAIPKIVMEIEAI